MKKETPPERAKEITEALEAAQGHKEVGHYLRARKSKAEGRYARARSRTIAVQDLPDNPRGEDEDTVTLP